MITIIDLGISNIKSISRGFSVQGFDVKITASPGDVEDAASLVLPGVGAFPRAMEILQEKCLFDAVVGHAVKGRPLLGVCLGMQLLFTDSDEHGHTRGLGIIPGHVVRFPAGIQVPHMGWNRVVMTKKSPLLRDITDGADFYFVHSYTVKPQVQEEEIARTDYHGWFTAAVGTENVFGVQFHPEKSQRLGLLLLKNFAMLTERGPKTA